MVINMFNYSDRVSFIRRTYTYGTMIWWFLSVSGHPSKMAWHRGVFSLCSFGNPFVLFLSCRLFYQPITFVLLRLSFCFSPFFSMAAVTCVCHPHFATTVMTHGAS